MQRVTVEEGVRYGLSLTKYILGVAIVSLIPLSMGYSMGPGASRALILVGVAILALGLAGLQFKIIADAVAAGLVIYHEEESKSST